MPYQALWILFKVEPQRSEHPLGEREFGVPSTHQCRLAASLTKPWLTLDVPCAPGTQHGATPGIRSIRAQATGAMRSIPPSKPGACLLAPARSSSTIRDMIEAARICLTPLIWVHRPGYYSAHIYILCLSTANCAPLGLFNSSFPRCSYTSITN